MTCTRREHLLGWASCLAVTWAGSASALGRPAYTGEVRLVVPTSARSLDPHDVTDLNAALFGSNLFECLYGLTSDGQPYPTLADGLPEVRGARSLVRLRPGMTSAKGRPLDAATAAAALLRAEKAQPWLGSLGSPRVESPDSFSLVGVDTLAWARRLASPALALVPRDFDATRPDGHGPFVAARAGNGWTLTRNVRAPRGGAYLDQVNLESAELSECLRAFEAGKSDLGWLGAGLYRKRPRAVPFRLASPGLVYVVAGQGLGKLRAPGVLQAALNATPNRAFESLGYERSGAAGKSGFPGRSLAVAVPDDVPQLVATAEALAEAWSSPAGRVSVTPLSSSSILERRRDGQFDVMLGFARTSELSDKERHALLVSLDGGPATWPSAPEEPERLARRLGLGVLGRLIPQGSAVDGLLPAFRGSRVELADLTQPTAKASP